MSSTVSFGFNTNDAVIVGQTVRVPADFTAFSSFNVSMRGSLQQYGVYIYPFNETTGRVAGPPVAVSLNQSHAGAATVPKESFFSVDAGNGIPNRVFIIMFAVLNLPRTLSSKIISVFTDDRYPEGGLFYSNNATSFGSVLTPLVGTDMAFVVEFSNLRIGPGASNSPKSLSGFGSGTFVPSIGQTFVANGNIVTEFSLVSWGMQISVIAGLFLFNTTTNTVVGNPIITSSAAVLSAASDYTLHRMTCSPPQRIVVNATYLIVLSTAGISQPEANRTFGGYTTDPYPQGMCYSNKNASFAFAGLWERIADGCDFSFSVTFNNSDDTSASTALTASTLSITGNFYSNTGDGSLLFLLFLIMLPFVLLPCVCIFSGWSQRLTLNFPRSQEVVKTHVTIFISYCHYLGRFRFGQRRLMKMLLLDLVRFFQCKGYKVHVDLQLRTGSDMNEDLMNNLDTDEVCIFLGSPRYVKKSKADSKRSGVKTEWKKISQRLFQKQTSGKPFQLCPLIWEGKFEESIPSFWTRDELADNGVTFANAEDTIAEIKYAKRAPMTLASKCILAGLDWLTDAGLLEDEEDAYPGPQRSAIVFAIKLLPACLYIILASLLLYIDLMPCMRGQRCAEMNDISNTISENFPNTKNDSNQDAADNESFQQSWV